MEVDSSVKRANDLNLEEVSSATQQKRVKTVFKTLWDDTNSEKPFQVGKLNLREHILAKSNELRSLEAIASDLQDPRVEARVEVVERSGKPSLVVVKKRKASLSDDVPFDDVRLVVDANGEYRLFVYHFELVRRGTININQPGQLRNAINEVVENRPCPGVDTRITGQQDYLSSEVEEQTLPWHRVLSRNCARLIKNAQCESGRKCRCCYKTEQKLSERLNQKKSLTEEDVRSRQSVSSKVRFSCLSPKSQSKRLKNMRQSRKNMTKQVKRYRKKFSVLMSDTHSSDLDKLMERVESTPMGRKEFEKCVAEADSLRPGAGQVLREIWDSDKVNFRKDQAKNGYGHRSNRWTQATWRVALAIYARCPVLFDDLKKLDILQLPCRRSLERVMAKRTVEEGIHEERIIEQLTLFNQFKTTAVLSGRPEPLGVGELLFDETKVQSKIQIRCTDGVAIGYAMNENDWSCLHDVYESLFISEEGAGQRASYVLQTYWRDMTSGFEFAGPYFLREVPLDGKFLHDIVFKVISTLEKYRFHVILLVGDGASCNLALFKRLCGYANEQLPVEDSGAERYQFKASFINPFSTRSDKTCFVMICPAHQLKNIIAALYS
ncbi:uncharacterized protein [Montipora capricornis]|uniref:uncharacterized protein n=1 Tax=Montipora capricornis TaxID=246305 RepID=UPI0035F14A4F